jgi:hypothetical protein
VVASLNRIDVSLGFEAGLSVVILAIFLDRITAALGGGKTPIGRFRAARKHRGTPVQPTATDVSATAASATAASDTVAAEFDATNRPGALVGS